MDQQESLNYLSDVIRSNDIDKFVIWMKITADDIKRQSLSSYNFAFFNQVFEEDKTELLELMWREARDLGMIDEFRNSGIVNTLLCEVEESEKDTMDYMINVILEQLYVPDQLEEEFKRYGSIIDPHVLLRLRQFIEVRNSDVEAEEGEVKCGGEDRPGFVERLEEEVDPSRER